jgi:hypothetical protein
MWWETLAFWLLVVGFFGIIIYLALVGERNYFEVHLDDDSTEKDEEIERLQRLLKESEREVLRLTGAIEEEMSECTTEKEQVTESGRWVSRSDWFDVWDTSESGRTTIEDAERYWFPDLSPWETVRSDGRGDKTV